MAFSTFIQGAEGEQFQTYSDQRYDLGTQLILKDGRKFRFALAGGSNLVAGNLQQAAANTANHLGLTPAATAVGALTVSVTLGATAAVANEYTGGNLLIVSTAGQGYAYEILSHPAISSAGTGTFTLLPGNSIQVALTGSSVVDLIHSPYWKVIINPTSATQAPVGVAIKPVTSGLFGWLQTFGPAAVLTQGTVVLGNAVVPSTTTAGAVAPSAASTSPGIGYVMRVNANTSFSLVFLTIDA